MVVYRLLLRYNLFIQKNILSSSISKTYIHVCTFHGSIIIYTGQYSNSWNKYNKKKERKILNSIFEMILYNIANIDLRWATHTFYTWLRSVLTCLSVWRSCETGYSYILHMALFCTHLFISMTFLWDELLLYFT